MSQDPSDFPHSGALPGLTPSEREDAWRSIETFVNDERSCAALFEESTAVSLSSSEKEEIFRELRKRMGIGHDVYESVRLPWYEQLVERVNIFLRVGWVLPAFCLVLIFTTVGATYASADSVPGDFLYSIKRVGEQIRSGFLLTDESRAESEQQRMAERVREFERLHQRSALTDDVRQSLDQEFRLERRAAIQYIQEMEESGNQEASSRLRARLNAIEDRYNRVVGGDRSLPEQLPRATQPLTIESQNE